MPLPFAVILTLLLFAGLSMLFAGLHIRRGDRPRCAKCSYDLSALIPANCPECNGDLSEPEGIVRGDRRPFLAGFGLVLVLLSVVGFGIGFLGGATLDQRKPVWILDVELSLVNEHGEERIKEELRRRLFDTATSIGEKHAIADLALRRARTAYSEPMSLLLADCEMSGVVDAEKADPYMRELIALWSSDWLQTEEGEARAIELCALIQSCGIELEALNVIIGEAMAAGLSQDSQTLIEENIVMPFERLLWNWWQSPSSPGVLTDSYLQTLFKDAPAAKLTARPIIDAYFGKLPYEIEYVYPPVFFAEDEALRLELTVESVRVTQRDRVVFEQNEPRGGYSRTHHHSYPRTARASLGTWMRVEGIEPGPASIEAELKFATDRGDGKVVLEKRETVQDSFTVELTGGDDIAIISTDSIGLTQQQLLEWFVFSPLYYNTSRPSGSSGPWSMSFDRRPDAEDWIHRHGRHMPDLDVAFRVLATQGETEWDIGTFTCRDVFNLTMGRFQLVSPRAVPTRIDDAGEREWGIPKPELDWPVRLRLEPAPDVARRSIDITAIYGEAIDLGEFTIVQTDRRFWAQRDQGNLSPAPILQDE